MQAMTNTTREVDDYLARYMKRVAAVVELSGGETEDERLDEICELLDIDRDGRESGDWQYDEALEIADTHVYDVTEHGKRTRDVTGDRSWQVTGVELLLGGGGPTVTLTCEVDEDGDVTAATLWHSWGESVGHEASARTTTDQNDVLTRFLSLLGLFAE